MRKIRIKKLSIKILLLLFVILAVLTALLRFIGFFAWESQDINEIATGILYNLIMPVIGLVTIFTFVYAIDKTVVARVRKLKDATNEVMKGNFDVKIDVKGSDELSNLTESFNKMTGELKANEYLSKEFVRNISHEFKTPMSSIRGYAELIDSETADESLKEYAQIIVAEADRLSGLSKSIIQLSLLDSTTIIKKEDTFSPSAQIRGILQLLQPEWEEKNIKLDCLLDDFVVTNNENLLYQIWQNLIKNAVKFSNCGGKIEIVLSKNERTLIFKITDNGIGIKDEDKNRIFTPFFVSDKSRNTDGSGLGLHIVKKITEKLGGTLGFESKENEGTEFAVEIQL